MMMKSIINVLKGRKYIVTRTIMSDEKFIDHDRLLSKDACTLKEGRKLIWKDATDKGITDNPHYSQCLTEEAALFYSEYTAYKYRIINVMDDEDHEDKDVQPDYDDDYDYFED